jgi:hypothetical protein
MKMTNCFAIGVRVLALSCLLAASAAAVEAQNWRGAIRGVVLDASGAVIVNATIVARAEETELTRDVQSGNAGEFAVASLAPGAYVLEVRAPGHKTWRRTIALGVNQELRVEAQLEVGEVSQVVQVAAEGGTRGPLGARLGASTVQALPLDGRNFLELALLTPGTAPSAPGSASSVRGDFSFTANGARDDFNSYLLDGADNVDPKLNTLAVRPAVDAIREFEVLTSAYDAAFGRYAGAQVNVVTRSGTNVLGGSAHGFIRNRAFDARNRFAIESEPAPEYERYQGGASIGGPIVNSRTFFFANYEGSRRREGITRLATVPTVAERNGDFTQSRVMPVNPQTGQPLPFLPSFAQHPIGRAIAALYPMPNRASGANFISSPIERDTAHQINARVDHGWSRGGELTLRYSLTDRQLFEPFSVSPQSTIPGFGNDAPRRAQSALANDARVLSGGWLNELRAAFVRVASDVRQEGQGASLNRQVGLPELSADSRDWGLSFISVLGYAALGHEINNPQHSATRTIQLADTMTWSRGRHLVKFGGEARFIQQDAFRDVLSRGQIIFTGQITGNAFADLLLGAPVLSVGARLDNPQHLRTSTWSAFVQDSWTLGRNVTVNAGLRYELVTPPVDRDDRANIYDEATGGLVQVGTAGIPRGGYDSDRNNVAPRISLSWSPSGSDATTVRGGYGIYYSQSALAPGEALYFSPPYFQASFYFPLPGLPLSLSDPFPAFFPFPSPPSALAFQRDLETPALQHWNTGVQQQLGRAWSVEFAYAGSRGRDLLASRDINQPGASPSPFNFRPNPAFADITLLESRASSRYHAFMATVERRLQDGFSLRGSYTLSSSKDDASGFFSSTGDPNFPQDSLNPDAEWGRSSFDVRHRVSLAFVYDLPLDRLADTALLRDWMLSGIVTVQSGRPFTVALLPDIDNSNTGRSSLGFGANDRPNMTGDPELSDPTEARWFNTAAFAFPAFGSFGNAGRNILEGPGYANVNLAVMKWLPLGGGTRLQLRAEAFNLLNRTNYGLPDAFLGSPTFGQILSADAPRRCQFGARLVF